MTDNLECQVVNFVLECLFETMTEQRAGIRAVFRFLREMKSGVFGVSAGCVYAATLRLEPWSFRLSSS